MRYALLVAMREFAENVKTKGFWIGIFMLPILLFASFTVPRMLEERAPTRRFTVYDPTGEWTPLIDAAVEAHHERRNAADLSEWMAEKQANPETPDFEPRRPTFVRVPLPGGAADMERDEMLATLRPYLLGEEEIEHGGETHELFALFVLPERSIRIRTGIEYWATNLADDDLQDAVSRGFEQELKRREFLEAGVDPAEVERIEGLEVELAGRDPQKEEGEEAVSTLDRVRQYAPLGFVYLLFVAIMTVAQMLLGSTVEEKSNRIFEVLLSSVTPWELMLGKLLGIAGVGITMLVAWIGTSALVLSYGVDAGDEIAGTIFKVVIGPKLLGAFVVYFLFGYLLYASICIALGSLCNTLKDAQNFMGPVMIVLIVPLLTMVFIVRDPNGALAKTLSWIPPFTPFVMMNRAAGSPPLLDVVGTLLLLVVSVGVVIWFAGRIFRNGILRTGQPPKLLEILRLVRG